MVIYGDLLILRDRFNKCMTELSRGKPTSTQRNSGKPRIYSLHVPTFFCFCTCEYEYGKLQEHNIVIISNYV